MRATITDREALLGIRPPVLARYLKRKGWRKTVELPRATIWVLENSAREEFEIALPENPEVRDFSLRISEVLRTLDAVEGRSQLDIFNEIRLEDVSAQADAPETKSVSTPSAQKCVKTPFLLLGLPLFTWLALVAAAMIAGLLGTLIFQAILGAGGANHPVLAPRPPVVAPERMATYSPDQNLWLMFSTVLAQFAAFPGLALFFAGLVRRKNVLSVFAQCGAVLGVTTILWFLVGYSLAFNPGGSVIGRPFSLFSGETSNASADYAPGASQKLFAAQQMMFAIMAAMLIIGAVAERVKYSAFLLFTSGWLLIVFCPLAHMMWGSDGLMNGIANQNAAIKAIDFAGGSVVHMAGGWSALIFCLILGRRHGLGREPMPPHSIVLTTIGTGILWVGWYGLNGGRAVNAGSDAANAFVTTTIAAAVGSFIWPLAEWFVRGKPSVLGFCSGAVAGLVVITPACGFVTAGGALVIGVAAGLIPWFVCYKIKAWFGYDDALDIFGVHGVGGTLGLLMTGSLARNSVNPQLAINLNQYANDTFFQPLIWEQLKAIVVTVTIAVVGTTIIAYVVKGFVGLRAREEFETAGLDLSQHGEEGYHTTD